MGKIEGVNEMCRGHVTALSVDHVYRRLNIAGRLMKGLEEISEQKEAFFVDLFVRVSNKVAYDMYTRLGYSVYRRVLDYYSGDTDEDAYGKYCFNEVKQLSQRHFLTDMRKALSRDKLKKSIIPLQHPVRAEDLD